MAEFLERPGDSSWKSWKSGGGCGGMTASEKPELMAVKITRHEGPVLAETRAALLKQRGATLWLTGLSGSGKSTLAFTLEQTLLEMGRLAYVLDGDNIRFGLNASPQILADKRGYSEGSANRFGLGFSAEDREENIRRIGEVARLFSDCGVLTMASFISPYRADRDRVRALHRESQANFIEIYVKAPIEVCEQRDPKGLYKQARAGQLKGFTGIDAPYEEPLHAEMVLDASRLSPQEMSADIVNYLKTRGIVMV